MDPQNPMIGTAGWNIPKESASRFPGEGTHLERYARVLKAVEIDSSFYQTHLPSTYERWAASTPEGFQFAVKVPKEVTHVQRLMDAAPLQRFLQETGHLGSRLGPWLLQLPPGLAFHPVKVERFLDSLRSFFHGAVVCEPRHPSWFTPEAEQMLSVFQVARAAADPAISPDGTHPGGWRGLIYYRLHGSPRMYHSAYTPEFLRAFQASVAQAAQVAPLWCIFNNTAEGAAAENAGLLRGLLSGHPEG